MTRLLFLIITFLVSSYSLQAQTVGDALRYSKLDFAGTARSMGVGGTLGALGADFSVMSTNPAGLATYRSSDFMVTPAYKFMDSSSDLIGSGNDAKTKNSSRLLLDNIGYVYASQPVETKWEAINFAVGVNKIADFYRKFEYEGDSKGSIVDRFVEQARGFELDNLYAFEDGLAYGVEAIYDEEGDLEYESDFQFNPDANIQRSESVKTTGAINELVFSLAGNFNHKLMMGITIGVPLLRYRVERTYSERDPRDEVPFFNDLTFTETIETTGSGLNVKLGVIYRPIQMIRVGVALHSPTRFELSDEWQTSFNYDYVLNGELSDRTEEAINTDPFEYALRTPWRAIGSVAFLFKKRGFLSAELEYLDYANTKFNLTEETSDVGTVQYENALNDDIKEAFSSAINFKLGGELAFDIFRIRAGYGMFGTSYADKSSFDPSYSFGLGMRQESYYLDLAYRRSTSSDIYSPYSLVDPTNEQQITNESNINKVILTLGFRF